VLIMALDEPRRDAQKSPWPAEQRCDLIFHGDVSRIRRGRLDVVNADSGNDMRQATARRRAMCSAWADAFGSWATAIEPCGCEMALPQRESQWAASTPSRLSDGV